MVMRILVFGCNSSGSCGRSTSPSNTASIVLLIISSGENHNTRRLSQAFNAHLAGPREWILYDTFSVARGSGTGDC
jgi:hypothetical protein